MRMPFRGMWLTLLLSSAVIANSGELRGTAVSLDDGRVLYTEYHRWHDTWHRAEYRTPDGRLLAVSELDYSPGRAQPAFTQTDEISGDTKGARWSGDRLTLFHGQRSKVMDYREPLVIGSGFNNFVREHWNELIGGQRFTVNFAVPERLMIVRLTVQRIAADKSDIPDRNSDWVYFRVRATNPILAWFVDPVDLAYDAERHLRVYRGSSNIDIAGHMPAVEIRY